MFSTRARLPVALARAELQAYGDATMASEKLVEAALKRHADDNVTAMVIWFNPIPEAAAEVPAVGVAEEPGGGSEEASPGAEVPGGGCEEAPPGAHAQEPEQMSHGTRPAWRPPAGRAYRASERRI